MLAITFPDIGTAGRVDAVVAWIEAEYDFTTAQAVHKSSGIENDHSALSSGLSFQWHVLTAIG